MHPHCCWLVIVTRLIVFEQFLLALPKGYMQLLGIGALFGWYLVDTIRHARGVLIGAPAIPRCGSINDGNHGLIENYQCFQCFFDVLSSVKTRWLVRVGHIQLICRGTSKSSESVFWDFSFAIALLQAFINSFTAECWEAPGVTFACFPARCGCRGRGRRGCGWPEPQSWYVLIVITFSKTIVVENHQNPEWLIVMHRKHHDLRLSIVK